MHFPFRIGKYTVPKSGPYIKNQDVWCHFEPDKDPTLKISWSSPGFFGKDRTGDFIFPSSCWEVAAYPASQLPVLVKEAALMNAKYSSPSWVLAAGPLLGSAIRLGIDLVRQGEALRKEEAVGLKILTVFYSTSGEADNRGFFVGIADAHCIDGIIARMPIEKIIPAKRNPTL